MSDVSRWRDSGQLERAVQTAGGQQAFDAAVAAMLDDARGWRLAEMRKRRGMTQQQVATWMGVSVARVSQIENGDVSTQDVLNRFITALGGWACEHYVRQMGTKDPPECVVDELAGQLLALSFAPRGILAYALAFALFRALDIWKPGPIAAAERLPGGLGVMADDVLAGLLAGLVVAVFAHAGLV